MGLLDKLKSDKEVDNSQYLDPEVDQRQRGWNSDSDVPPPAYDDDAPSYPAGSSSSSSTSPFTSNAQLQIEAVGFDFNAAMYYYNHEQIKINDPQTDEARYLSLRPKKKSNSCGLSRCDATNRPIIATQYRIGPYRHPRIKILAKDVDTTVEDAIESDTIPCERVQVDNKGMFSRTQVMKTSFGTFQWRYGSRDERKAVYADSLLIMELVDGSKNTTQVAQLIRNDEFRTPGTKRDMGGNGGRLFMDMNSWRDNKQVSTADVEAFMVASCICMLKREADRYKDNAVAAVT